MGRKFKWGLLPKIFIAIILGLVLGSVKSWGIDWLMPVWLVRVFLTFNNLFSSFLGFCIPLIILGLVAPSIADLGRSAGKLLLITVLIAYTSTLFSGFFTYVTCRATFPYLISPNPALIDVQKAGNELTSYFTIDIVPVFDVMTALLLAFVLGIGIAVCKSEALKAVFIDFRNIVEWVIKALIIPLLPIYIFGIFLNMTYSGAAFSLISIFGKIIGVIFILHFLLLIIQYTIAGIIVRRNPFRFLWNMLPAYMTALGTSSSAATIPVTLAQVKKGGVHADVADFCVPLCATIHLAGSVMKITAMALAICILTGMPFDIRLFSGFIIMLGMVMVAAPGVPGGAIMAAVGVLQSVLGFGSEAVGLMIALYIAIDSFGTACNVTGDGAIALIVDKIAYRHKDHGEERNLNIV